MLRFLRRLFHSAHPLDPENLGDKARDITFRVMENEDIETCLSFYRANEAAHFPPGRFDQYATKLRNREFLNLIATRNNELVGCCGIHYSTPADGIPVGFFCYGMVAPLHQRKGVGTAQVLVRLSLLTATNDLVVAAMTAVPNSLSFYKRFGFDFSQEILGDDGERYRLGLLKASSSFIDDCRMVLVKRNISYPDVRDMIPHRSPSQSGIEPPT